MASSMNHDKVMKQGTKRNDISFTYTNHKGETSIRTVVIGGVYYGATEWHPDLGWILDAFDLDRKEKRKFALKDCDFTKT